MKKLRTSNDSINALIDRTLDFSLIYSELNNENNLNELLKQVKDTPEENIINNLYISIKSIHI